MLLDTDSLSAAPSLSSGDEKKFKYKSCFEGLGKLKDFQLDIPIDQNVKPVAQPMRRVPFNMRDKLEQKLNELVDIDVIERAEGPTPSSEQPVY